MSRFKILDRINFPLIIGLCIVLLIAAVSFYPERFATSDPYGKETLQYEKDSGKILIPPVPPGEEYAWGTDERGRDLRSLVIYGCQATMVMALGVALVRLIIALPLATAAAYKNKAAVWLIDSFNITFSAIPMIMIVLLLTRLDLFNELFANPMTAATFIMSVFGWSKLAKLLTKSVENVLNQDFIEGEIAIGKTKLDIAMQNVMPHIIPSIVVFFFLEIAVVLLLLAQVGVLGLIVSGGLVEDGSLRVPYEFDWASMLVFSHYLFNTSKMWLITYPAAAFALSIIGFNLLGEGIRIEFEKRDSRIITTLKKVPGILSPFRLIYELKNLKVYRRQVGIKASAVFLILLIMFFPSAPSKYPFDSATAFNTILDIGSSDFKFREYRVGRNVLTMDYLADKLQSYGIQPFDGKYVHEMKTEETPVVKDAAITINQKDGSVIKLSNKNDFIMAEPVGGYGDFSLVKLDRKLFQDHAKVMSLADKYNDKVILLDTRGMEYSELSDIVYNIKYFLKPEGVILIEDWMSEEGRGNKRIYIRDMDDIFVVLAASDKGDELLRLKDEKLSIKIDVEVIKKVLYGNVMGIIPGKDPLLKNDIIIIGGNINGIMANMSKGYKEALGSGGTAIELELARMLGQMQEKPDRTIIFAFWDETNKFSEGAKIFTAKYINASEDHVFYVDIGKLDGEVLVVDSSGIKPKNKKGQSYVRSLKGNIADSEIDAVFRAINNSAIGTFKSSKQEVLAFDSANPPYKVESKKHKATAELEQADLVKFHNIGQMIIDTVFDIIYDKRTN